MSQNKLTTGNISPSNVSHAGAATSLIKDRFIFHWSVLSVAVCLFIVGFSTLSWLRDDLPSRAKITLELACCSFLALDFFLHKNELRAMLKATSLRIVTVSALIPWYSLVSLIEPNLHQVAITFLTHATYMPYLYVRFKYYSLEHVTPKIARALLVVAITFFSLHWLASIWMVVQPTPNGGFWEEYVKAMYFLITTVTTIGYGDITPTTTLARIYTMGLQLLGVCMFGVVVGQVSRLIVAADKRKETTDSQLEGLVAFCKHYEVPLDLQKRSYRFLKHILSHASNDEEERVIASLPAGLQAELRLYMNIRPIARVSLFKGCSHACLKDAALELEQIFFTPGQVIIKKDDPGNEMYLIGHGEVEVYDGHRHIARLSDGQCFGEMALVMEERRAASVRSVDYSNVFKLSRARFSELLAHHPDLQANVDRIIIERKRKSA